MTYTENDLIIPTLALLADAGDQGLTTTEIKDILLGQLELSPDDLRILSGRNDTHFSQQVRNLVSHDTLTKKGLAMYEAGRPSGRLWITDEGKKFLAEHEGDFDFLVASGFTGEQRKRVIDRDFEDLIIEEGHFIPAGQVQKRKRSRRLTQLAREHYAQGGKLWCAGCNFNFDDFYGETAKNYIEIHHLKPIHTYGPEDTGRTLAEALEDVRPLCSNCHRMAHRDGGNLLNVQQLRELVVAHGKFAIPAAEAAR